MCMDFIQVKVWTEFGLICWCAYLSLGQALAHRAESLTCVSRIL